MDGNLILPFVLATFLGGFVSGFSGFAMGLVVSGIWLHIITPIQTAALIAGYGLLTQGYGIAKLRHELSWQNIWPLTLGTAVGIPAGVMLLTHIDPVYLRFGCGVLLALYAIWSLARPPLGPFGIGAPADMAIGIANGLLGGLTGLGGVISTISCQLRGWSKDKQRAVFQPVLFAAFVIISISQLVAGSYTAETIKLYGIGLPFMVAGIWIGFKLYGTINDEAFRKAVLILVLLAGVSLLASSFGALRLVPMAVMEVGIVHVLVPHRLVLMPMGVRLGDWSVVVMLVMFVVDMPVLVRERFMKMFVLVPFGEMQPKAKPHQQRREGQLGRQRLAKAQGDQSADERGQRKIGAGAGRPEIAKRKNEQNEADADRKESQQAGQQGDADRWQAVAKPMAACNVRRARDQTLDHRNCNRVGRRQFAGQVVVDPPA